jgi:precorrin-2/cobalt-factor-2 C20-methyltransferase
MIYGTLYGVGVGPGAPDLMTLRSVQVLRTVPVIAIPRRSEYSPSIAWEIARPNVGEVAGQERLFLTFPMTKDPERLRPAWDEAFAQIGTRLEQGLSVAFITEGDPLVYSTFIYLLAESSERWPGVPVEIVPAVSSITAVPAVTRTPVADGQERIAVLPATYGVDDLADVLRRFDTIILMKVGSVMPNVVAALEREALLDRAFYVSKATTGQEKVVRDLRTIRNDRCDYFSMVVVAKQDRNGLLAGRQAASVQVPGTE